MLSRLVLSAVVVMAGSGMALAKGVLASSTPDEKKAWLGVYLGSTDDDDGVKIIGLVGDDSPAAIGGIEEGDILIRFDGETVSDLKDLVDQIGSMSPGEKATVDLERDGRDMSVVVVLGTRPQNIELKGLRLLGNRAFSGIGIGPKGMFFRSDRHWPEELQEVLEDIDFEGGKIKIKIECDDGAGTVTIETDGETQIHEFDCEGDWDADKSMAFSWHGDSDFESGFKFKMPRVLDLKIPHLDLDLHLDDLEGLKELESLSDLKRHFSKMHVRGSANTRFNVDSDGQITVTVTKGDNELTLNFDSAADLKRSRPDLYDKYEDLISELE